MAFRLAVLLCCFAVPEVAGQQPPTTLASASTDFGDFTVVSLKSGANSIDLNGDGKPDVVFDAWRDNGNAHGFEVITFYLADPDQTGQWRLLPLYDSTMRHERDFYRTFMGADCVLEDLVVVRSKANPHAPAELVLGSRQMGQSFVDSMPVTFTVYQFVSDSEATVGSPPYYFRATRVIRGRHRYCDINDAFEHELGLGHYPGRP